MQSRSTTSSTAHEPKGRENSQNGASDGAARRGRSVQTLYARHGAATRVAAEIKWVEPRLHLDACGRL